MVITINFIDFRFSIYMGLYTISDFRSFPSLLQSLADQRESIVPTGSFEVAPDYLTTLGLIEDSLHGLGEL